MPECSVKRLVRSNLRKGADVDKVDSRSMFSEDRLRR